jgi:hypothetical protein
MGGFRSWYATAATAIWPFACQLSTGGEATTRKAAIATRRAGMCHFLKTKPSDERSAARRINAAASQNERGPTGRCDLRFGR